MCAVAICIAIAILIIYCMNKIECACYMYVTTCTVCNLKMPSDKAELKLVAIYALSFIK